MSGITEPIRLWPKLQGEGHWVAVDTETTGLYVDDECQREDCGPTCPGGCHITVVSLAGDGWSVAIPFDTRSTDRVDGFTADHHPDAVTPDYVWYELLDWLSRQNLIFHHAKFDLDMLRRGAPHGWKGKDLADAVAWDTKLACWVLWPLESTSLKPTAERLWGRDERNEQAEMEKWLLDHKHKKFEMWYVPFDLLGPYARQDAALTYRLQQHQTHYLTDNSIPDEEGMDLFRREFAVMRMLSRMEARGVGFDAGRAAEIAGQLEQEQKTIEGLLPFRPTRMQAIKWWSANGHQAVIDSLPRTDAGAPSMDEKGREILASKSIPHAEQFSKYLDIDLALSRYYGPTGWRGMVGKDGRLRPDYRQDGTTSMRFSCSRINLQAIPQERTTEGRYPDVRQCFVPAEGKVLVELDLKHADLRVATAVARCKNMRRIFLAGGEPHGATAKEIFHITEQNPEWDHFRHLAKTLNFAILYGAGPGVVAEMLEVPREAAEGLIYTYRAAFPEFTETMRRAQTLADQRGYIILVSGRKRYFKTDENTFKAFNAVIQGNVAEAMKDWMLWIERVYPGRLLLQVHDSVVLELPEKQWVEITNDIANAGEIQMTEIFGIPMPIDRKPWHAAESSKPTPTIQEVRVA